MLTKETNNYLSSKKLVVAVSGGIDSMALIHLLLKNPQINKKNLIVAHFDHKIRAQSSKDANFVKNYCQENELKFELGSSEINQIAKKNKENLEATARAHRYQFLEKIRKENKFDLILTAHHQDDNLETVIMNWQRGTGVFGLSGIKQFNPNTKIYRPLLGLTKSEIINYASKHQLQHITDNSNFDLNFRRNLIRHQLMPQLTAWRTDYKKTILELIKSAKLWQNEMIHSFLAIKILIDQEQLILNKKELSHLPDHKLNLILIYLIRHFQTQTNRHQITLLKKNIKNKAGNKLCLIGKLTILTKGKSILLNTKL